MSNPTRVEWRDWAAAIEPRAKLTLGTVLEQLLGYNRQAREAAMLQAQILAIIYLTDHGKN